MATPASSQLTSGASASCCQAPGSTVTLASRRGEVTLFARDDDSSPPGTVFVAFCWAEAAINRLTNPALDPVAKIPEFKYCAVRATAGGTVAAGPTPVGTAGSGPASSGR